MLSFRSNARRAIPSRDIRRHTRPICEAIERRILLAAQLPVNVAVTSNLNPSNPTDDLQLTATVTATSGTPTGTIEFLDGNAALGVAQLSNGSAILDVGPHLSGGSHAITAFYDGDANFESNTSPVYTQLVRVPTIARVMASQSTAISGNNVTFTVSVNRNGLASTVPGGNVELFSDATDVGSAPLDSNGNAIFNLGSLAVGQHQITAQYPGDTSFAPSTSPAVAVTITQPPLLPVVLSDTLPAAIIAGTSAHGIVTVAITNKTASPITGLVTVAIYASTQQSIQGATLLAALAPTKMTINASQTVLVRVPIKQLPANLGNGTFHFLPQITDPDGNLINSASGPTITVAAPFVALSPTLVSVNLPPAVVSGTATKAIAKIRISNAGNIAAKSVMILLSASTTADTAGSPIINVMKKLTIKPGGSALLSVPLKALPSLPDGDYFLVAQVTDAFGAATTTSSSTTFNIAAPFVKLTAAFAPLTAKTLQTGATVTLANSGNVDDLAVVTSTLGFSTDAAGLNAVGQTIAVAPARLRISKNASVKLHLKEWKSIVSSLPAGIYFLTATIADQNGNHAFAVSGTEVTVI